MNEKLQEYARTTLKKQLQMLTDRNRDIFKRMYSPDNIELDINEAVDNMPAEKLDWAMQQVQRTVDKL